MSSSVSNLQLLNNTEYRVKFKTGSDINNALDPLVGEMFLEKIGQSDISFDGQSKIDTDYKFGGGEISLSAWVKTTNNKDFIIATDSPSGGNDTSFAIGFDDNKAYILIGNPGQQIYKTGSVTAINDGNWHNIIVTIDGSKVMNFYIDGLLETTHTFTIFPGASDYVTHYGSGWSDGAEPLYDTWGLDGQLNGLGIWERVLTDKEINIISSSGRYSPAPSHFSPDLWVGPTGPSVYICTDTSGAISKVSANLKKMGDVPMLRLNQQKLDLTDSSYDFFPHASSGTFCYSFWFYDDGSSEERYEIIHHGDGGLTNVVVAHGSSSSEYGTLEFIAHGNFDNAAGEVTYTSPDSGVSVGGWWNPSIISPRNTGFDLKYKKNKLNNFTFVKANGVKNPTHVSGSRYVYLNGELVASDEGSSYYTYPKGGFKAIGARDTKDVGINRAILLGDIMYWDQDISSIAAEIYNPLSIHKGYQGDTRNLSIPPRNYWRLGLGTTGGEFRDAGSDGTNHFIPNIVSSNQYEYKNIFGIDRSTE